MTPAPDDVPDPVALGTAIRAARDGVEPRMSQAALGELVGYQGGAAVTISRVEAGKITLNRRRREAIAAALGLTDEELRQRAVDLATALARQPEVVASAASVRQQLVEAQKEVEERTTAVTGLVEVATAARDDARDHFFLPFVRVATTVTAAPALPALDPAQPPASSGTVKATPQQVAALRLRAARDGVVQTLGGGAAGAAVGSGVGAGAAYAAFTAAATWGTASTGAAISGLSGIAASNAVLALLGGGTLAAGGMGVAGGTALLAGIVGGPALLAAAAGAIWMAKVGAKRKDRELRQHLDATNAHLRTQEPGYERFCKIVPEATAVLQTIAVHGGRAQQRWSATLPPTPRWDQLDATQQQRYDDLVQVCAAQLSITTIDFTRLLQDTGQIRDDEADLMDQVLQQAATLVNDKV